MNTAVSLRLLLSLHRPLWNMESTFWSNGSFRKRLKQFSPHCNLKMLGGGIMVIFYWWFSVLAVFVGNSHVECLLALVFRGDVMYRAHLPLPVRSHLEANTAGCVLVASVSPAAYRYIYLLPRSSIQRPVTPANNLSWRGVKQRGVPLVFVSMHPYRKPFALSWAWVEQQPVTSAAFFSTQNRNHLTFR